MSELMTLMFLYVLLILGSFKKKSFIFSLKPEVISNIESLLELWMDNNKIQYLPKDIKNLKNLMFLDLSKNKLKKLPNEIGECTALSDLYLSENEITELPETIGMKIFSFSKMIFVSF